MTRLCSAFTLIVLSTPAWADPVCSGGGYAADALVVPTDEMGALQTARQYAWDGGSGLAEVCELLSDGGDFFATWSLFSGEVDAEYGGICVSLVTVSGAEWYSCRTPDEVAAAFDAAPGTAANTLQFAVWEPVAPGTE